MTAMISSSLALKFDKPLLEHDDVIGKNFTITANKGDTIWEIGYEYGISVMDLKLVNKSLKNKNGYYKFKGGESILIPQQFILPQESFREGIVINMAELRLYYFDNENDLVYTYPVGMGKSSTRTPTMDVSIKRKVKGPHWYPPDSIRKSHWNSTGDILPEVVYPGPKNPLGTHAIYLSKPKYLIHGNNKIRSIGGFVSSGCIRLYNKDIKQLHGLVKKGEPVRIVHHTVKMGTLNDQLYVESHPEVSIYEKPNYMNTVYIDDLLSDFIYDYYVNPKNIRQHITMAKGIVVNVSNPLDVAENRYEHQLQSDYESIAYQDSIDRESKSLEQYNADMYYWDDDLYSYDEEDEYVEVFRLY